ncbi:cholesterol 7-desaturase nvd [Drosophila bipectinata]|uniref:cholesterol 7-desaturase nvd n=1 Tax=Drosophila bipectinata TaxID=42026 RepID=UPI0038B2425F
MINSRGSQPESIFRKDSKRFTINRFRKAKQDNFNNMPPPYPNGWYGIVESCRLNISEAIFISCLGEKLVVYRTQNNKVFIVNAYCPHLGANFGVGGRVDGDCIVCPFHQWSFRGSDGKCIKIPYSTSVPRSAKVKSWISQETNGIIFVWYHIDSTEKPWSFPMTISDNQFIYHGRNEFYVNCHIREIPENGADTIHFNSIHNECFMSGNITKSSKFFQYCHHKWNSSWMPSKNAKHLAEIKLSHSLQIFGRFNCFRMDISGLQIGPSYVTMEINSSIFGTFRICQTITPIEPLLQKVIHRFYGPRWLAPFMKIFICGESIMFQRDVTIWNHKDLLPNPILAKEDTAIKQFRMWYSQFYTCNSKSLTDETTNHW